jgi:hypothetical protein
LPSDAELEDRIAGSLSSAEAADLTELARQLAGVGRARIALDVAQHVIDVTGPGQAVRVSALRARARAQSELGEYTAVRALVARSAKPQRQPGRSPNRSS